MNRREFIQVSALAGGGLLIGVSFVGCGGGRSKNMRKTAEATGNFSPDAFLTITPENTVLIAVEKQEMGQGVFTSHAMLVAEELEMPIANIHPSSADGGPAYRSSMGAQSTGGSSSLRESFVPMRTAAATARVMLMGAAAAKWGVKPDSLTVADGVISHNWSDKKATFGELASEAALQEIPKDVALKPKESFKILGTSVGRVDGVAKSTGRAAFGMDVQVEGKVYAYIIRPPVMSAPVKSFEKNGADKEPGVVEILSFERGVAVVAEKYWQARRAAKKIDVIWGESELSSFTTAELRASCYEQARKRGTTVAKEGNVEKAFRKNKKRGAERRPELDVTYEAPYLAHATMEPMNAIAHVDGKRVEIWAPTQNPTMAQDVGAKIVGCARDDVIVHTPYLGGGFGRRTFLDFVAEAVLLSKEVQRPVHVVWTREDDTRAGYYRPFSHTRMRGILGEDNKPEAWSYHNLSQSILGQGDFLSSLIPDWLPDLGKRAMLNTVTNVFKSGTVPDFVATEGASDPYYAVENFRCDWTAVTVPVPVAFWRSVGHSYNGFAVESFVDEFAHLADEDPYEFRKKLLKNSRDRAVLDAVAEMAGWGAPVPEGVGRGIAVHKSFDTYVAEVADVRIVDDRILVDRVFCVVDCGMAINPDIVKAQMEGGIIYGLSAVIDQEITFINGQVQQGNFDTYPSLRINECPDIQVKILNSGASPTGVGEPGLPPVQAAVANAIFDLTGVRLRKMPLQKAWDEHRAKEAK